jgi:heme/copper-type cytochrome/quinol oxidase subunit 3
MEPLEPETTATPRAPLPDPTAVGRLGLRLFLISLSMLFAAGLVALIVSHLARPTESADPRLSLPPILWLSTLLLLLSGMAIEGSARAARRARIPETGRWLRVSCLFGCLFTVAQSAGMTELLARHELSLSTQSIVGLHGLAFALVLIHAVHVFGGLILVGILVVRASLHRLSLEHLPAVRSAATYWHFLEVVWVTLLVAIYVFG